MVQYLWYFETTTIGGVGGLVVATVQTTSVIVVSNLFGVDCT